MSPITTTTEVNRAPAEVFDYVTDPTRFISATSSADIWTPTHRPPWAPNA